MIGGADALVAIFFAVGLAVALVDWRKGLLLCVAVGFLQDPVRKLWPGEPVYLTAAVGVVLVVTALGATSRRELLALGVTPEWRRILWLPVTVFGAVVLAQAGRTLVQYQSVTLTVLGLMGYLAPLTAAALGFAFARSGATIVRFLACYTGMSVVVATGVYLGFLGYEWPVLEQVGEGLTVFSQGFQLEAYPGFMRSPEVAAWHAGAAASLLVILGVVTKRPSRRLVVAALILFLVGAAILTGRRKATVEILLFLAAYWGLLAYARAGVRKLAAVAALAVVVAWVAVPQVLESEEAGPRFEPYVMHSASGFSDAPQRFTSLGLGSVEWAIRRHGLAGAGAGTGSQGAQHFGGGTALVGGAPEGGLGKIATELGLPGLIAGVWAVAALIWSVWRGLGKTSRLSLDLAALRHGLIAFLSAKSIGFVVAAQVYGDLFVLLILGWILGFVLAIPRLAATPPARLVPLQRTQLDRKHLWRASRHPISESARWPSPGSRGKAAPVYGASRSGRRYWDARGTP